MHGPPEVEHRFDGVDFGGGRRGGTRETTERSADLRDERGGRRRRRGRRHRCVARLSLCVSLWCFRRRGISLSERQRACYKTYERNSEVFFRYLTVSWCFRVFICGCHAYNNLPRALLCAAIKLLRLFRCARRIKRRRRRLFPRSLTTAEKNKKEKEKKKPLGRRSTVHIARKPSSGSALRSLHVAESLAHFAFAKLKEAMRFARKASALSPFFCKLSIWSDKYSITVEVTVRQAARFPAGYFSWS